MRKLSCLLILLLTALFGPISAAAQQQQAMSGAERGSVGLMLLRVHEALKKNYYDPHFHGIDIDARYKEYSERIKKDTTLGDALRHVAAYLSLLEDSHTYFVPPQRSYHFDYGYRLGMVGNTCYVMNVRPGSDAAQKLHPGDQVLSLDGFPVNREDLWQVRYLLRTLSPRTVSAFTLRDPAEHERNETVDTKIRQGQIVKDLMSSLGDLVRQSEQQERLVRDRYVEQGDLMIWKMPEFSSEPDRLEGIIKTARKHKALVLDLRGDPGGYEDTLTFLLGSVLDHDVTIGTRVGRKETKPLIAKTRKDNFAGQLIVLVDDDSASAAELFARVIQLEHRGTIVGDRTSGSVMEGRFYDLSGSATASNTMMFYGAMITASDIVMKDGKSLEKVGVTPDVVVLPTASDLAAGRDPALARAVELAGGHLDPVSAGKLFPYEWAPAP